MITKRVKNVTVVKGTNIITAGKGTNIITVVKGVIIVVIMMSSMGNIEKKLVDVRRIEMNQNKMKM